LRNHFGTAANTGNLLRCIGRSRSVKNLTAPSVQKRMLNEHDMTIYPAEFHRRPEQKWASRIEQILALTATAPPPRDPNDDDDEDEDEEDEDQPDEPAVVREPDED
jgi:hypothetical protein